MEDGDDVGRDGHVLGFVDFAIGHDAKVRLKVDLRHDASGDTSSRSVSEPGKRSLSECWDARIITKENDAPVGNEREPCARGYQQLEGVREW